MPKVDSFVEHTLELLEPLGPVRARAMFGGWGLSYNGLSFGLIADGQLYLKVDEATRTAFEAAGGEPFTYERGNGKPAIAMSYWTPPTDASDDAHALLPWARRAVEAAQRAQTKKPKKVPAAGKKSPARKRARASR